MTSHQLPRLAVLVLALPLAACGGPRATSTSIPRPPAATTVVPAATPKPTQAPTPVPPVAPVTGLPIGTDGYPWWNDTVFYEIFVRSFSDGDGDGTGDLDGLIAKLDYLNDGDPATTTDLGVTGLWLMPIHPAASYHGYDVLDYYAVHPDFGTLDDFKRLLDEAHRRGIRVLIDWVPNHTSDRHPWFQAAQDPGSPYRDWYLWSPEGEGSGWHRSVSGDYYYGFFSERMPDLNYMHPAVSEQMQDVARFWLSEVGVDGFRVDAVKYLIEEGYTEHTAATHAWLRDFRSFYKALGPQTLMVGEVWDSSGLVLDYTGGDELDLGFDFDLANAFVLGARVRNTNQLNLILPRDAALFRPGQFATFLTNHDMSRAMSQLGGKPERARSAAALLLTSPGVPFIYYGEEIGMTGLKKEGDREIRTPMQWSPDGNAGFSSVSPWQPVNADYETVNVAAQALDPDSLLSFYRTLIRLRANHAALRVGDFAAVNAADPAVFAMLRTSPQETVLVLINLGEATAVDAELSLSEGPLSPGAAYLARPILGDPPAEALVANAQGGFDRYRPMAALPPFSTTVLQLQAAP